MLQILHHSYQHDNLERKDNMSTRSFKLAKILGATGTIKATALDSDAVGGGVKLAENDSADLGTGAAGDLKFASNRKTLHLYCLLYTSPSPRDDT